MSLQDSVKQLLETALSIAESGTGQSEQQQTPDVGASRKEVLRRCRCGLVQLLLNITAALSTSPLTMSFSMPSATRFDQGPLPPMQSPPVHGDLSSHLRLQPSQQHKSTQDRQLPSTPESFKNAGREQSRRIASAGHHDRVEEASQTAACLLQHLSALHFDPAALLLNQSAGVDGSLPVLPDLQPGFAAGPHDADATQKAGQAATNTVGGRDADCCSSSVHAPSACLAGLSAVARDKPQPSEMASAGTHGAHQQEEDGANVAHQMAEDGLLDEAATAAVIPTSGMDSETSSSDPEVDGPGTRLGAALALLCTLACPPAQGKLQAPSDCGALLEAAGEGCRLLLDAAAVEQVLLMLPPANISLSQCRD